MTKESGSGTGEDLDSLPWAIIVIEQEYQDLDAALAEAERRLADLRSSIRGELDTDMDLDEVQRSQHKSLLQNASAGYLTVFNQYLLRLYEQAEFDYMGPDQNDQTVGEMKEAMATDIFNFVRAHSRARLETLDKPAQGRIKQALGKFVIRTLRKPEAEDPKTTAVRILYQRVSARWNELLDGTSKDKNDIWHAANTLTQELLDWENEIVLSK